MKNLICILLTLAMALSLVACGNKEEKSVSTDGSTSMQKAISVGSVAPSEESIKGGSYAVQRPFVLVTKEGVQLSETAQAFFDFATSAAANEIIAAAGVVPVN